MINLTLTIDRERYREGFAFLILELEVKLFRRAPWVLVITSKVIGGKYKV